LHETAFILGRDLLHGQAVIFNKSLGNVSKQVQKSVSAKNVVLDAATKLLHSASMTWISWEAGNSQRHWHVRMAMLVLTFSPLSTVGLF
jgi:hypothetical protein